MNENFSMLIRTLLPRYSQPDADALENRHATRDQRVGRVGSQKCKICWFGQRKTAIFERVYAQPLCG
jgi:hypothetical protein